MGVHGARLGRAPLRRHRPRPEDARPARAAPEVFRGDGVGAPGRARGGRLIYEIFRQERKGQAFQHAGSLAAPNQEFAETYAKEFYGRRGESAALWGVSRDEIV